MSVTPREREHTPAIPGQRPPGPAIAHGDPADLWADMLDDTELVTLTQISEAFGVNRVTLHGWVKRNLLQARYINDAGHPMYSLVQAHAVHLRIKLRGRLMNLHPNAEAAGWCRPQPGEPWQLSGREKAQA